MHYLGALYTSLDLNSFKSSRNASQYLVKRSDIVQQF